MPHTNPTALIRTRRTRPRAAIGDRPTPSRPPGTSNCTITSAPGSIGSSTTAPTP